MDEREWEFANADKCVDCGADLPLKVCHSAAGYFIGKQCPNDGPYSRLSTYLQNEPVASEILADWLAIQAQGGDLRQARNARVVGYVPGPMVRVDFPEPRNG